MTVKLSPYSNENLQVFRFRKSIKTGIILILKCYKVGLKYVNNYNKNTLLTKLFLVIKEKVLRQKP